MITIHYQDEVEIIKGKFKGVRGRVVYSGCSTDIRNKVNIKVDNDNTLTVYSDEIEPLNEEYLIYKTDLSTGKIVEILGKYVYPKTAIQEVLNLLQEEHVDSFRELCDVRLYDNKNMFHRICKYQFIAILTSEVKLKFLDKELTKEECDKILK